MTDFEALYNAYFHDVFLYVCSLSGDEHVAEEITSDTFFRAMRGIGGFRGDCEPRTWLCQIAKNCYFSYRKRQRALPLEAAEQLAAEEEPIGEELQKRETLGRIREILHSLDNPYKEVFMWRALSGLSFKEIGALYGKTENWACVTYHRARRHIKARLEEEEREA
ncbi:MAG: sigma-70 family RNA polymerase sigma factor [Ruminococcaceae bacterium]|nr:sigma-70 family RNA polymerase sigma factor [Oscillospiraceae bacterium]